MLIPRRKGIVTRKQLEFDFKITFIQFEQLFFQNFNHIIQIFKMIRRAC